MTEHKIERLGHHGDGIAEGPIFAPLTLPGEVVTGTVDGTRLRDVKIVTPAEDRVAAPCSHFKSCGGCQLQHASDGFVAAYKVNIVKTALASHGITTEMRPCLTSPRASRRRASFSVKRTKKGAMSGFHARGSDILIEVPNCILVNPDILAARPIIEAIACVGGSRKAELTATVTLSNAGLDIAVSGGKPLDGPLRIALAQETEKHGLARLAWDDEVIAMRHAPSQTFGSAKVVPPAGSFLQATPEGEADLLKTVQEIIGSSARVIDLFSGCGTFSLPLAKTAEVHAVEGEAEMVKALDAGWRQAVGLKKVTHEARDLFRRPLMPDELKKFDAAVIDPPRAGAEAQVAMLAESNIKLIAYVSCNPVTFARDAATLEAHGFSLDFVQTVDQFRWSSHTELVAKFSKA